MKKLIGFISVSLVLMLAASCDKGGGAGAFVENAYNGIISGDYQKFVDAIDCGEDSLPADQVKQAKDLSISMLQKTMDGVKNGTDEEAKAKLPQSCKALSEKVSEDGNTAEVELEITTVGGEKSTAKVQLKKNKAGEWKITNSNDIMPKAPETTLGGAEDEEAEEATEEATEETAEETAEEATEEATEEPAAEEATEE